MRLFRLACPALGVGSFALLSFISPLASAAPEPTQAELNQARQRFGEARKLEDVGRWSEALELLEKVAEVKLTPQIRFHIALCREHLGRWTEALDGYTQAAGEAKGSAPDVVSEANEHIRKLEGSIPTVTLRVSDAAAGDALFLDERALPIDDHPLAIRADPGPHSAEVRRGETVVAREYLILEPKTTRRIELRVGKLTEPPQGWSSPSGKTREARRSGGAPAESPSDGSTQRALGYAALGLGGAAAIATGVFIGLRGDARARLEGMCPTLTGCPRTVEAIVSEGKTYAALVNVFGIVTGAAAASGIALLLTAPSPPKPPGATVPATTFTFSPRVGGNLVGIAMEGTF